MKYFFTLCLVFFISTNLIMSSQEAGSISTDKIEEFEAIMLESVKGQFGIDVEQDFFVDWMHNKNFDRNYTQGTGFYYSKPGLDKSILFAPFNLIDRINDMNGKNGYLIEYPATIGIGVTAFTPLIIDSPTPIQGDRPFAGLMYLTTVKNRYNTKSGASIQTSFNYGILGSNVTNTFQSWIHTTPISSRPSNISWHHQISRGGSFAFLFSHKVSRSILSLPVRKTVSKRTWLDASLGYRMDMGWYTGVSGLSRIKIGCMTPFSLNGNNIDASLGVGNKMHEIDKSILKLLEDSLSYVAEATKSFARINKKVDRRKAKIKSYQENKVYKTWDGFIFGSFNPRVTPYNSLILGQPHVESVYTLKYEDYNPFILDIEYGFVISRLKIIDDAPIPISRFDIIVSFNHRSPEIRNEDFKRWHHWGRISIRFPLFQ